MLEYRQVIVDYTNWRGERRERLIIPRRICWDSNEWHPESQWLLEVTIIEDGKHLPRTLAMKNIHSWRTA